MILRPASSEQVQQLLAYCSQNKIKVIPQGGNTSLQRMAIANQHEVILDLCKMNAIQVDEFQGVVVCQAGAILEDISKAVSEKGLEFPMDMLSRSMATIGGIVATNPLTSNMLKHGRIGQNITGMKVVLPTGLVLDDLYSH
jgi:FAD/FMN-containing dehydrogenase